MSRDGPQQTVLHAAGLAPPRDACVPRSVRKQLLHLRLEALLAPPPRLQRADRPSEPLDVGGAPHARKDARLADQQPQRGDVLEAELCSWARGCGQRLESLVAKPVPFIVAISF